MRVSHLSRDRLELHAATEILPDAAALAEANTGSTEVVIVPQPSVDARYLGSSRLRSKSPVSKADEFIVRKDARLRPYVREQGSINLV